MNESINSIVRELSAVPSFSFVFRYNYYYKPRFVINSHIKDNNQLTYDERAKSSHEITLPSNPKEFSGIS